MGIVWESNHYEYQVRFRPRKFSNVFSYIRFDFFFLVVVSSLLFWLLRGFNIEVQGKKAYGIALIVLQVLAALIEFLVSLRYSKADKKKRMISNWETLKQDQCKE